MNQILLRVCVVGFFPREQTVDVLHNCDNDKSNNNNTSTLVDVTIGQGNEVKRHFVLLYYYHARSSVLLLLLLLFRKTHAILLFCETLKPLTTYYTV